MLGTVAAAAACAKLRGLDAKGTATAIAIAASMSSGLVANFGTMTKSFQVGRAAQSGVIAARLAQAGLTASLDALEHPAGLLNALSVEGTAALDLPFRAAQKEWHIVSHGLNIKRYPICYATHRSIDAALDLVARHDLTPDTVERIRVSTGKTQMLMLRNSRSANRTRSEVLNAVRHGCCARCRALSGLRELTDDFVRRPDVQAIFPRVVLDGTDVTKQGSNFAPFDAVEITTVAGETLKSEPVEYAKGSHERPLSREELWNKFADCLGTEFPDAKKTRAFENLMMFDRLNGASALALQSV